MAKIIFLGATGQIGKQAVSKLLSHGHEIIAPVRSPEKLQDIRTPHLHVHEQNLEEDFSAWFSGCDKAVFCAGSGADTGADKTLTIDLWSARNAIKYARAAGVNSFILVSSIGADDPDAHDQQMKPYLIAKHMADEILKASGMNYTIVRPGRLTDDKGCEQIQTHRPSQQEDMQIPREDVANALVHLVEHGEAPNQIIELFTGTTPIDKALR